MHVLNVEPFNLIQFYLPNPVGYDHVAIAALVSLPLAHVKTPPCCLGTNSSFEFLDPIDADSFPFSVFFIVENVCGTRLGLICVSTRLKISAWNILCMHRSLLYFHEVRK